MNTMLPSIPIPTDVCKPLLLTVRQLDTHPPPPSPPLPPLHVRKQGSGWVAGTDTSWTPAFPANFFATATKASDINDVAAYICESSRHTS